MGEVEGTPFGRYRLVDLLGRGGMGEVWRAYDPVVARFVALKVLPATFADDAVFQERFRREARAAAGLDEPHVVPIYDSGEIDGRLFVSMRLVKGRDLQDLLRAGPLPPGRVVGIIDQIASALQAAHEVGLVHRDVKPSNILVAAEDFAYLIDFGIARAAGEQGLTSTGSTIGTWAYMAPERFQRGVADARCDTYALACVLFEGLTGSPPFPAVAFEQIAVAHMFEPPPQPSRLRAGISEAMDAVIATGMAKNPAERYTTINELATAAHSALAASSIPDPPPDLVDQAQRTRDGPETARPAPPRPPVAARPGNDLETETHLDFIEATQGVAFPLRLTKPCSCTSCQGSGVRPGVSPKACGPCNGSGVVHGTCTINVRIPPGLKDGQRILLRGHGEAGSRGAPPGDLYVTVHVRPDSLFRREGNDLAVTVPVSFTELALGAVVTVPSLHGPFTLKVPKGTPDGWILRLNGRGVPQRGGGASDLVVTAKVVVPPNLEGRALEALEAYAAAEKASGFNPQAEWPEKVLCDGDDLPVTVLVSFAELALGTTLSVPALDGMIGIRVPKGTPSGRVLRVRGRGMPKRSGGHGNLLVRVNLAVPPKLKGAALKALEAYAAAERAGGFSPRTGWPW